MNGKIFQNLKQKIILIGGDHHARECAEFAYQYLKKQGLQVKLVTYNEKYYDYIHQANFVARKVSASPDKYCGIVGCKNGFGVTTVCNKYPSVFAIRCDTPDQAINARLVNYSNVLTFGSSFVNKNTMKTIIDNWLCTEFELNAKNISRLNRLSRLEKRLHQQHA